ncbi:MAG TPA: tRNA lysidine(34) synthetase TilS [Gammaproteobacteria bacterium]|nr:tRNA lysidine(34) synthetase TilS [Gammaproteobacteria bacterium]
MVDGLPAASACVVAFSGGVDSHLLLHELAARRARLPAPLAAVHVHHGLQAQADAWARHCRAVCTRLGVPLAVLEVDARPASGESPEAAARNARYRALADWLEPGALLLTAQHRDDQAETLLLQLLRGAGPAGLAAMPAARPFGRGRLLRPLLGLPRAEILRRAQNAGLAWIEDPSNRDPAYARNFLRGEIVPRLRRRWPALDAVLARAATHQAEAAQLLDALAGIDLVACARGTGLDIPALARLDAARQRNLLRHWIRRQGFPLPVARVLERLRTEMPAARPGRSPRVDWAGAQVRRYRDVLYLMAPPPSVPEGLEYSWAGPGEQALAEAGGVLRGQAVTGADGARAPLLKWPHAGGYRVRFRRGGEMLRPAGSNHRRRLKTLLQEKGIPPWERERLPLIYAGETLAAVAGVLVCEGFVAGPGETGVRLEWSRLQP